MTWWETLKAGGSIGFFITLLALALPVAAVLVLVFCKQRRYIIMFIAVAMLPLLIGGLGTLVGNEWIDRLVVSGPSELQEHIETYRWTAGVSLYMGVCVSVPLVLVGLFGLILKGRNRPTHDE